MLFMPAQIKPKSFESRRNSSLFLPGVDASHVYVRALAQGCFQSYQYPNLSESADSVGGQLRGGKECPFSGVTKSGRVWRKVSESDARSVRLQQTPSTSLRIERELFFFFFFYPGWMRLMFTCVLWR